MSIVVKERQAGPVTLLEFAGRLTMGAGSDALDENLQRLVASGRLALLLDWSQVTAIDSQGIKALVRAVTSMETRGGKLKLLNPSPRVIKVLDITRLLTVIESFQDEETALQSFRPLSCGPV